MNDPEIVMIGLGYIGLPTAALIASNSVYVHGVDINQKVVVLSFFLLVLIVFL